MHQEDNGLPEAMGLRQGGPLVCSLVCVVFYCVLAVWVRGVRWDESFEFAQVIAGWVHYPDGHPMHRHAHNLFTAQTYGLAALMQFVRSEAVLNGLRNTLFLLSVVLPPFLLTVALARARIGEDRAVWWGHAAALLALLGIHREFFSTYPVQVWPDLYSNGAIGLGWALLTLALFLMDCNRVAFLLAGVMPIIHAGQWPPVLVFAGLYAVHRQCAQPAEFRRELLWFLGGLLLTALFAMAYLHYRVPPPGSGPYAAPVEAQAVYQGFMTHAASHRSLPWGTGQVLMMGFVLLAGLTLWEDGQSSAGRGPWSWLALYGIIVALLVWGTMGIHLALGPKTPRIFLAWMPYRLINHLGPLLIAMIVSKLAKHTRAQTGVLAVGLALVFGVLRPLLRHALDVSFYERYLGGGEGVLFLLYGAAIITICRAGASLHRFRTWRGILLSGAWFGLAVMHQFGAACVLAGALLGLPARVWPREAKDSRVLACLCATVAVVLLTEQWSERDHLPRTSFEAEAKAHLDTVGDEDTLVLAHYYEEGLQAKLGKPIMSDMATITWIPYEPDLGPALYKLYRDLYGIDLISGQMVEGWRNWPEKTTREWAQLAQEYGFQYVLTRRRVRLLLPEVELPDASETDTSHLYRIGP